MVVRLVLLTMVAGCLPKSYQCSSNSDCGSTGQCQPTGFCSYIDTTCSGGQRYGDLSGSYTGQCIGEGTDARIDSPRIIDAPADIPIDGPVAFCDTADTTLVGCWEFENTVADASGNNNNGTATSVAYATGKVGQAAVLTAGSHIAVPDSASILASSQLTIEGWINPTSLPAGTARMGILDDDGHYGFFIYLGQLRCFVNITVAYNVTLATSQWTHVACTYDGTTGTIYVNGMQAMQMGGGGALGTPSGQGIALGGNSPTADTLVGMIDQYRVYNVARTASQICRDAGLTTCP